VCTLEQDGHGYYVRATLRVATAGTGILTLHADLPTSRHVDAFIAGAQRWLGVAATQQEVTSGKEG
jgi:hypothetical protein